MSRVMLDTSAYSAFKRGDSAVTEALAHADQILLPVIVLGELWAGFRGGSREEENNRELEAFLESPRVMVHPLGEDVARYFAHTHAFLKKAGTPIPVNDLWIAACALQAGAVLIARDVHFRAVPGILLVP